MKSRAQASRWTGCALAAAGIAFTLPAHAFRTTSDLPEFSGAGPVVWPSGRFEYSIQADVPYGTDLTDARDAMVDAAFTVMGPPCTDISLTLDGVVESPATPGDGRNTIQWVHKGWEARGFYAGAGAADIHYEKLPEGGWRISECDIYLNGDDFKWTTAPESAPGTMHVTSVVLHEYLHCVGIEHACERDGANGAPVCTEAHDASQSVMLPEHEGKFDTLSDDDADAICHLYPQPPCTEDSCAEGLQCHEGSCQQPCGTAWCGDGQVCEEQSCVEDPDRQAVASCATDSDCPENLACINEQCRPGDGALADPCEDARDCAEGVCSSRGYCSSACATDEDCSHGTCRDGACLDLRLPFGVDCDEAIDCVSELCLEGQPRGTYCTRQCGEQSCPSGWTCEPVDGAPVCVPEAKPSDGCSLRAPVSGNGLSAIYALVALGCLAVVRRIVGFGGRTTKSS